MCKNDPLDARPRIRFWDRLHKQGLLGLPGDAPVIRFWDTLPGWRFYTCLRWVRVPLEEVRDVPEFVKAKAREIANLYPFLIVSYADESYYVEVWEEPGFERNYT